LKWNKLAQDTDMWRAVANTVMNLKYYKVELPTGLGAVTFSRRTELDGIR